MTLDDAMREPALKKQRTCTDYEMPSKEQELCLALNECRAALPEDAIGTFTTCQSDDT